MRRLAAIWHHLGHYRPLLLVGVLGLVLYLYLHTPSYEKFYGRGLTFLVQKQYDRAATEFLKAISEAQEDPSEAARLRLRDAYLLTGEIYDLHLGRYARAVEVYREAALAFRREPVALLALKRAADIYLDKLGNPTKAIELMKDILTDFPASPEAHAAPARILKIYLETHDYEQATIEGRAFLAKAPAADAPGLLMRIGDAYASLERWEEARLAYTRLSREFPKSDLAKLARFEEGNAWVRLGKPADALAVFEDVLQTYPNPDVVRLRIRELKARLAKPAAEAKPLPDKDWGEHGARAYKRHAPRANEKRYRTGGPALDPFPGHDPFPDAE